MSFSPEQDLKLLIIFFTPPYMKNISQLKGGIEMKEKFIDRINTLIEAAMHFTICGGLGFAIYAIGKILWNEMDTIHFYLIENGERK